MAGAKFIAKFKDEFIEKAQSKPLAVKRAKKLLKRPHLFRHEDR